MEIIMKVSFLGGGNMGCAIAGGMINSGNYAAENICISHPSGKSALTDGVKYTENNLEATEFADVVILCVKPNVIKSVLEEIKGLTDGKIVVSIAAGVSIFFIENIIGHDKKIIRVMPNTPALVGCGMSALCKNAAVDENEMKSVCNIFSSIGRTIIVSEEKMHAVTAVSGSGPAYIYMVMEALADGGVLCGLARSEAYMLAAQTVLGSAEMLLSTGKHPGELKDAVCSPGGTTIEAVASLEKNGMRSALIEAVLKCKEKSEKLM